MRLQKRNEQFKRLKQNPFFLGFNFQGTFPSLSPSWNRLPLLLQRLPDVFQLSLPYYSLISPKFACVFVSGPFLSCLTSYVGSFPSPSNFHAWVWCLSITIPSPPAVQHNQLPFPFTRFPIGSCTPPCAQGHDIYFNVYN